MPPRLPVRVAGVPPLESTAPLAEDGFHPGLRGDEIRGEALGREIAEALWGIRQRSQPFHATRSGQMIEVVKEFRQFAGALFGLQQSVVVGALRVRTPEAIDRASLEQRMREALGDAFPEAVAPLAPEDPAVALVQRVAQWTIAVQRKFRLAVSEGFRISPAPVSALPDTAGVYQLALPCTHRRAVRAALGWVCSVVEACCGAPVAVAASPRADRDPAGATGTASEEVAGDEGEETGPRDADPAFTALAGLLRIHAEPGLNSYYIAEAAYSLRMPVLRPHGKLLLIGTGCRGRWFESTITDRTSSFGVRIAGNKRQTALLLRRLGLPGAVHEQVGSADEAVAAASRLGYPVVVKPADRERGEGVAADLRNARQVVRAYEAARALSKAILVERHCEGFTHRLTVVEGRLVKVARRIAGGVFGDGVHTVRELVDLAGNDPGMQRRRQRTGRPVLVLDEEAEDVLAQSGRSAESIPPRDAYVRLRRRDNINAGGTNEAVPLDRVHPDNAALAIRIAALLRLDFAGIDLIISDVRQSWLQVGGLVCEVNAQPQMGTNDTPDLYRELLRDAFPDGSRIPVTLVVPIPDQPSGQALRALARARAPEQVFACVDGLFVEGRRISAPFESGYDAALAALALPETRALRFVMTPAEILRQGLPIDRVDRLAFAVAGGSDALVRSLLTRVRALVGDNALSMERW